MKKSSYGFLWKIKNFHVTMNSRYNFVLRKDKENNDMNIIGHVYTDFQEKFGIPRQSGLVDELTGTIVFLPEYRQPEAFRGLEDFSHIWILWEFIKPNGRTGVQQ